jgi:MFS family permease
VGTVNFAGDLGKMAAPLVGGAIAVAFGWRTALLAIGIAGTAFMVMSALGRRSVDVGKPPASAGRAANESDGTTRMGGFVTLSGIGFLDSATRGAALAFLPFVMVARDMSGGQVSAMLVLLFAGGAAGKFVVGWLGDRYGTVSLIWGTKALTAIMLVLSLVAPSPLMAPLMVALGVGLNGTSSILYATVAEFVPPNRRARQYGFFYTTNEGGSVLAPLVYGLIADLFSLNVSIVAMGLATAAIMPVSLSLRRHLRAVQPAATVGEHEPEF